MFQTLDKGFGQMIPQPQYSIKDKYALIHYIRESLVKKNNPEQYFEVNEEYLALLPPKLSSFKETVVELPASGSKPYQKMDFGTALFWTYQVNKGRSPADWNIAQKGIAVRLDKGPGGISKGKSWILYDEDTMLLRLLTKGNSSTGEGLPLTVRMAPTPRSKEKPPLRPINRLGKTRGPRTDLRIVGRDGRRFGPLPRSWVQYLGFFSMLTVRSCITSVGDREIHELPGRIEYGKASITTRTLRVGPGRDDLLTRLAPEKAEANFHAKGSQLASIEQKDGFACLRIKASDQPQVFVLGLSLADQETIASLLPKPTDPLALTKGGPA